MKISPNLYGRMDGSKFWCFPWFPENSLLCVILRYTVYVTIFWTQLKHCIYLKFWFSKFYINVNPVQYGFSKSVVFYWTIFCVSFTKGVMMLYPSRIWHIMVQIFGFILIVLCWIFLKFGLHVKSKIQILKELQSNMDQ